MKDFHAVTVFLLLCGIAIVGCAAEVVHRGGPAPAATTSAVEEIEIEEGGAPPPGMRVSYPGAPGETISKKKVSEQQEVVQ